MRVAPFDQRQRYEVVAALARLLPSPCRILDVGGFYRELDGEALLPIEQAVPDARSVTVDLERVTLPRYAVADGRRLPFADRQFDIVSCLDVLEHVPRDGRRAVADELLRVTRSYIVVAAPVGDDDAAHREAALQGFVRDHLGGEQQQLKEHAELELPQDAELRAALPAATRSFGYGNLDRWAVLMFAKHYLLGLPHNLTGFYRLDELYSALDAAVDRRPPFYRRFYLSARSGAAEQPLDEVASRYAEVDGAGASSVTDEALRYVFDVLLGNDPERLAAERRPLEERIGTLEGIQAELQAHIRTLEGVIADLQSHIRALEETIGGLQAHRTTLEETIAGLQTHRQQIEQALSDSQTHIQNLEAHITLVEEAAQSLRGRVLALEPYEREAPQLRQAVAELRQVLAQVEQSKVYRLYRLSQRFTGSAR